MHSKKYLLILLATVFVTNLTACKAVKDKFIRKKDQEKEAEMYLDLKFYEESSDDAFYKRNYIFAKGWLEEVQEELAYGSNLKKIKTRMDDAFGYIGHMKSYLNKEGLEKTKAVWDELFAIRQEFESRHMIGTRKQEKLADRLDDAIRSFVKNCSLKNIQPFLKD